MPKKKENKKSFLEWIKISVKDNKSFPWFNSGLILLGFTLGILVTTGINIVSRMVPQSETREAVAVSHSQICRQQGGSYDSKNELCKFDSTDSGQSCEKNVECDGWCLAPEGAAVGEEKIGICSEKVKPEGCFKYIDVGMVNEICLD